MSDPFIGEIRMFGGNFAPRNWAFCNGQILQISDNTALFSLLGTTYGGDGRVTFGLPELRGRVPIHMGQGAGLPSYQIGQKSGGESETLSTQQIPADNHTPDVKVNATCDEGDSREPAGNVWAAHQELNLYADPANGTPVQMAAGPLVATAGNAGGNQQHNNMGPFQCVTYIIALLGVFPSSN